MTLPWILIFFSLIAGQVIKIPLLGNSGITLLDLAVFSFDLFFLIKLKFKLRKIPIPFIIFSLFLALAIASSLITPLKLTNFEHLIGLSYIGRLIIYLVGGWIVYSLGFEQTKNLIKVLLFSGIGLAMLGILQLIFLPNLQFLASSGWDPHYFRTVSTLLDPSFLGGFLVLSLLLLLSGFSKLDKKWQIILGILLYLAIVTTFSRSTGLMLAVALSIFSILNKSYRLALLTLFLVIIFGLSYLIYSHQIAQPRGIDRGQSASYRVGSYEEGLIIFNQFPISGVGFNNYRFALPQKQSSGNDSSLLFIAATTGIAGLIIYLLFLLSLLRMSLQSKSPFRLILLSGLGGLLVHSLFVNSLFYPWFLVWILFMAGLVASDIKD